MRNKKLISRILVILLSILMMLTSIPFNLIAFAADDGGGGAGGGFGGGGGSVSVIDNPINDEDIGLRFSLVTKDASGKTKLVQNIFGKYYLDVWCNEYKIPDYGAVNSYSRYAPLPTDTNIERWSAADFDATIAALISSSGKGEVDMGISNHIVVGGASASTFFTEANNSFYVNGDLFYKWFMKKVGTYNGESHTRYYFFIMANGVEYKELNPLFIPHIKKPTGLYFFCLFSEKLIRSTFEGVIIN